MIQANYHQAQGFAFSMQTSSGDKIDLSSYASKDISLSQKNNTTSLSLKETFGYSFSYQGDGLDKQDIKEVKEALEKIKPLLSFLNPKDAFKPTDKNISDKAQDIKSLLPQAKDNNMTNYMKDKLTDMMDQMLKAFKANDETLTLAKDVFDALDKQMSGLELYA